MPIVVDLNEIAYFRELFAEVGERNRKEGQEDSVVRVRKKLGYSVEQIADLLSLDEGFVRSALEKAGII